MIIDLSARVQRVKPSPTLTISANAAKLRREGVDVISLSTGEPDFDTPRHVQEAAIEAIRDGQTRYTAVDGTPELKQAVIGKFQRDNGLDYTPEQILVSVGGKQSFFNLCQALLDAGDEVIIPAPYWVSYPDMVLLADGVPVIVEASQEQNFKLTPEQLEQAITPKTKLLVINSPSNPTGVAYTEAELKALGEVLLQHPHVLIASDDMYEHILFGDRTFSNIVMACPDLYDRSIVLNGVSKAYAMTGWRIGYAAGPKDIIGGADKIQSHSTSNASSVAQYAALAALNGPQFEISRMVAEFQRRRNYVVQRLNSMSGINCNTPEGAFYVFPNVQSFFGKEAGGTYIRNSYGLAYYLLREAKVALVPGAAFGKEGFIRISYATSMDNLEKGLNRIEEALAKLKTPSKVQFVQLNNYRTNLQTSVTTETRLQSEKRAALETEARARLKYDRYFEWNANINGVIVQLRTNNGHLYDFWVENWYPAQLEADLEPHAVIYAVDGAAGREPSAFYHADSHTGFLFNTDYYGSLRSLALGMVSDIGAGMFDLHALRGMSADYNGHGFVLLGPKGTHKSELFLHLIQEEDIALHANDLVFVRYGGGYAAADMPERKMYFPTVAAEIFPELSALFDHSKCENVITDRDECRYENCSLSQECRLEKGMPYCYFGSEKSAAMLDPYWIGGMRKHVKRVDLRTVFLLTNEPTGSVLKETDRAWALNVIESGMAAGQAKQGAPFYNPHLLLSDGARHERQKRGFEQLLHHTAVYRLNTGVASPDEAVSAVLEVVKK